ncbi:uncharacterized protein BP5553_02633 [Venustampulla echinocandica]|uniref:Uncharacterized protein n=1 Tax=Venustampulla echinocandica TaxID=2656787 RepID=A0A370TS21_9HELO|nr:uncharacterized protein BP5553_02633 [Venustampulla echinocandica]RDL38293.1 hypothetical protein BP5553_02633 [Venustampulla echinocandica]
MVTIPPEWKAALEDKDTILQAISNSHTFPRGLEPPIPEPNREPIQSNLRYLTEENWVRDYRARTWGYTIIRTAYRDGDDDKFQNGVDAIHRFARLWSDNEVELATEKMKGIRLAYEATGYWPEGMPETANMMANETSIERSVNDIVED